MVRAIAALLLVLPLAVSAQPATPPPAEPPRAAEPTAPAAPAPAATTPTPAASTPGSAAAPAPAAPAAPLAAVAAAQPKWSFGAGVGFGGAYALSAFLGSGPTQLSPRYWPVLVTSLERRLGGSTWLVVDASGWFHDDRTAWENTTEVTAPAEVQSYGAQLSAGLRRALTRAGAPVEVSVLALADAGVAQASLDRAAGGNEDETAWMVGGSIGFAVERALVDRLSLRVASPVLAARYSKSEITAPQDVRVATTRASADLVLAPRLELRLAF